MNHRQTFTRAEIAGWASILGALALVAAGLLYILQGYVSGWVFACVVLGVGGLAFWMWGAPGEFQAWLAGRQTRQGTTSILVTILFVGFVAFTYVLIERANISVDLTSRQRYSLNTPTLNAIDQLQEKDYRVRIVGFFSRYKLRDQQAADLLLRMYEKAGNGAIDVRYIDPDQNPDIAQRYGYQPGYDGGLFLTVLGAGGEPDPRATPLYLGTADERDITTGLLTVASAGTFKVYFTTGHGELDLERTDEIGISSLRASLVGQGVDAQSLRLLDVANTGIPDDASAVIIAGARARFTDIEVQLLTDYMQRGGRLAIFTDAPEADTGTSLTNTFLENDSPFSNYLWDEFGIRPRDDLVVEQKLNLGSEFTLIVDQIMPHEILSGFEDTQIVMRLARSIELATAPQGNQGMYVRQPLLYSSDGSYGESDLLTLVEKSQTGYDAEQDTPGPLVFGVTAHRSLEFQEEVQPRLVVIGDSDVITNEFVQKFPGNTVLWSDTVDWLTGFSQAVKFTPVSDPTRLALVVSDQQRNTIAYITMLLLPGIVLAAGAVVWWYRQH